MFLISQCLCVKCFWSCFYVHALTLHPAIHETLFKCREQYIFELACDDLETCCRYVACGSESEQKIHLIALIFGAHTALPNLVFLVLHDFCYYFLSVCSQMGSKIVHLLLKIKHHGQMGNVVSLSVVRLLRQTRVINHSSMLNRLKSVPICLILIQSWLFVIKIRRKEKLVKLWSRSVNLLLIRV